LPHQQQQTPERQSSLSESDSAIARTMTTASNSSSPSLHCAVGVDSDSDLDGGGGDGAEDDDGGGSDVDNGEDEDDEEEEDEDDEFDSGSSSHESLRDSFWDALLKEPRLRTAADVEVLVENVQKLPAFSNLSEGTRTALCRLMLVAVVREAGQVVLSDGEILDTWSVILNGTVEVVDPDGTIRELTSGDAFGVRLPPPSSADGAMSGSALAVQRHRGQMRTVTEDCQFVCVAQADYFRIMAQAADAEVPEVEEDGGRVVLVYEDIRKGTASTSADADVAPHAPSSPSTSFVLVSRVVIKVRLYFLVPSNQGTPEKLIDHLKSPEPSDPSYPEDLLLTYRTFLPTPALLVRRLLTWWEEAPPADRILRSRIQRYVVLWVHNHPADFYDRPAMLHFLETFSDLLQRDSGNRRLLHLACSTRARSRTLSVTLTLIVAPSATCHIILPCVLFGGQGEFGIFVNQAEEFGGGTDGGRGSGYEVRPALRRGDQLLALQQTSVEGLSLTQLASLFASLVLSSNRQPPGTAATRTLAFTVIFNPSREFTSAFFFSALVSFPRQD
uniref:Rap guanine nucleotide exchange factor 2 n=1 Tax=Taenia asiatica TaxID=60517 RepID=A0A0R3VXZ1_TAEAS